MFGFFQSEVGDDLDLRVFCELVFMFGSFLGSDESSFVDVFWKVGGLVWVRLVNYLQIGLEGFFCRGWVDEGEVDCGWMKQGKFFYVWL